MFPEYRDLITHLKSEDPHFVRLFDKHNNLDQRIQNMEAGIEPTMHEAIETLKKEKLHLKDELYAILRKKDGQQAARSGGQSGSRDAGTPA